MERKLPIHPWPLGIILAFLVIFAVHVYVIYKAIEAPYELVAQNYYEQGLAYDEVIQARERTAQNQWTTEIQYAHDAQSSQVLVRLQDRETNPVTGLAGTFRVYRPSNAEWDHETRMQEVAPGQYRANLNHLSTGLWHVTLVFRDGQETLYAKTTKVHI